MDKTQAARWLDAHGIPYRATVYDPTLAFHSAEQAAALMGLAPEVVYKTLVVLREGRAAAKPLLVLIPAPSQVDLKRLARQLGEKRLRMATQREAERLTGLRVGGISALGVRRGAFEILVDESAAARDRIHVSAGVRGVDLELRAEDLVAATGARWVRAASPPGAAGPTGAPAPPGPAGDADRSSRATR